MKIKDKYTIVQLTIKMKFGSGLQRKFAEETLTSFLKTWGKFFGDRHKKNEVGIFFDRNDFEEEFCKCGNPKMDESDFCKDCI